MQVWAEPGWYMLVTLLWAPALDTHGMVALVGATGELPLAEGGTSGVATMPECPRYGRHGRCGMQGPAQFGYTANWAYNGRGLIRIALEIRIPIFW